MGMFGSVLQASNQSEQLAVDCPSFTEEFFRPFTLQIAPVPREHDQVLGFSH
jgi:hypothetical protein